MERKTSAKRKWAVSLPTKKRRKTPSGYAAVTQRPRAPRFQALGQNPLPMKLVTKLAYNETVRLTGGSAGATAVYVFNASSLYDPNYTGTGHQPLGFDQIMAMYDHYVVLGAKVTVKFAMPSGSAYTVAQVGVHGAATVTPRTNGSAYVETGTTSMKMVGFPSYFPQVTQGYSPKVHMGVTNPMDADKLQGQINANPTDGWYWHVFAEPHLSSETVDVFANVTIEYTAAFIEPVELAQS